MHVTLGRGETSGPLTLDPEPGLPVLLALPHFLNNRGNIISTLKKTLKKE